MRGPGRAARGRASGAQPGAGRPRRARHRQDRAAGLRGRDRAGFPGGPGGGRRVRDGAAVRGAAPALRPVLGRLDGCRARSATRWGWRSACARAARRIVSWSAWRPRACCQRWPPSGHCCAWSMMRSGWTRPRRRRWRSRAPPAGRIGRHAVRLRDPAAAGDLAGCPGWWWRDWPMRMPGRCWPRSCPAAG